MNPEKERVELKAVDSEAFCTVWRLPYRRAVERTIALDDGGQLTLIVAASSPTSAGEQWTAPRLELNGGPIYLVDVGTLAAAAFQLFAIYGETFPS